jgi:hypothetical protein
VGAGESVSVGDGDAVEVGIGVPVAVGGGAAVSVAVGTVVKVVVAVGGGGAVGVDVAVFGGVGVHVSSGVAVLVGGASPATTALRHRGPKVYVARASCWPLQAGAAPVHVASTNVATVPPVSPSPVSGRSCPAAAGDASTS